MRRPYPTSPANKVARPQQHNAMALIKSMRHAAPLSKRVRGGQRNLALPFVPPEDWHEPAEDGRNFRVIVQDPGDGFHHILSPAEIRARLAQLPPAFTRGLEVVQLSRMTRKKQSFPCYGMQWGAAIYLYPLEDHLVEYYDSPPKPSQINEARMYGVRWEEESRGVWKLVWNQAAIKDFYLNNILIHELGHLLDERNSRSVDRERYAEWFAIEYGYKRSQRPHFAARRAVRRHAR
jgi:hypothetical protein